MKDKLEKKSAQQPEAERIQWNEEVDELEVILSCSVCPPEFEKYIRATINRAQLEIDTLVPDCLTF